MVDRPHKNKTGLLIVAVVLTVLCWIGGGVDNLLYEVGLNWDTCITSADGATLCGDKARDYERHVGR